MMKYAVTGSTGRFGRTVIKTLLETVPASDIIALARDTEKAADLLPDGIEIRPGEYEDAPRLSDSLQGVNRLLLISSQPGAPMSRPEQHQNVIDAAKDAGVAFIAYTSFPHADTSTAALAADHQATEKALRNSGLAFSFLRNNWYLENDFNVIEAGANGQPVIYSAGQGRVAGRLKVTTLKLRLRCSQWMILKQSTNLRVPQPLMLTLLKRLAKQRVRPSLSPT